MEAVAGTGSARSTATSAPWPLARETDCLTWVGCMSIYVSVCVFVHLCLCLHVRVCVCVCVCAFARAGVI